MKILTERMEAHPRDSHTIERYEETGGYTALKTSLQSKTQEQILEEIKASEIRGRGGAFFPTGMNDDRRLVVLHDVPPVGHVDLKRVDRGRLLPGQRLPLPRSRARRRAGGAKARPPARSA